MTLEGAIKFNETESYTIYTMNSATTGQYGIVMPNSITGTLNMLVDLHMKSSFDGVSSGVKTKEQLVEEISDEYKKIKTKYVDGMLVIPMTDENMFKSAIVNNDKQKMFDEVKKIGAITSELYKKLTDSGVEKQKIDQKIIIVEKNEDDEKFVVWLKEQMPNFVDGIRLSELSVSQEGVNPFVASNDIFGAPVVTNQSTEQTVSTPVVESNTTVVEQPVSEVAPVSQQNVALTIEETVNASPFVEQPNITPAVEETVSPTTPVSQPNVAPTVEVPKPVSSVALDGTIAFTPIPNHPNNPVEPEEENGSVTEHASKGFANLIILLIILVGVTIASVELGKYLYSVYGA